MPKRVPESEKKLNRSFTISPSLLKKIELYQRDPANYITRKDGSKREATFTEVVEIALGGLLGEPEKFSSGNTIVLRNVSTLHT